MGDIENPFTSFSLDTSGMGTLQNYQFLTKSAVLNSLELTTDYLANAAAFHDSHGTSALDFALAGNQPEHRRPDRLREQIPAVRQGDVGRLGHHAQHAPGLSSACEYVPEGFRHAGLRHPILDGEGSTTTLGLDYKVTLLDSVPGSLPLDVNGVQTLLGLATGTTPGNAANLKGINRLTDSSGVVSNLMPTTTSASFDIPTGLDLSDPMNPKPFLFDSNDLASFGLNVSAPQLYDVPVSVGAIGLYIDGGKAYLNGDGTNPASNATFTISLEGGGSSRNYFDNTNTLQGNSLVTVSGQAGVSLPIGLTQTGNAVRPRRSTITVLNLANQLDNISRSVAPILAPSIAGYAQVIEMVQNTPNLTAGINTYLLDLQNLLNAQVFDLSYPIVGTQLVNIGQITELFRVKLSTQVGLDAKLPMGNIKAISQTLTDIFGPKGLNWLDGNVVETDDVPTPGTFVNWSCASLRTPDPDNDPDRLQHRAPRLADVVSDDAGQDSQHGRFEVRLRLEFQLRDQRQRRLLCRYIDERGRYIDETRPTISFDATPHSTNGTPQQLHGTFGYFGILATPDSDPMHYPLKTEFQGAFTVTINGSGSVAGELTYQDLLNNGFTITPTLTATSNTNLPLTTYYPNTSFSLQILADYEMQWNFPGSDPRSRAGQPVPGFFGTSQPTAGFYEIGTNWADAVENFLGPGIGNFINYINNSPIGQILDFLEKPLPVISYLLGPTDLVDFLGYLGGSSGTAAVLSFDAFLGVLNLFRGLYAAVPPAYNPNYHLVIDQGSMTFNQDLRTVTSLQQIVQYTTTPGAGSFTSQINNYELSSANKDFTTDEDGGIISGKLTTALNIGLQNTSISLPIFTDPNMVKKLLLGGTGDLFQLITPPVVFTLSGSINFPPIPIGPIPLLIRAGAMFSPSIQLGYGFDTRGFQLAAEGMGDGNIAAESSYFIVNQTYLNLPLKIYFGAGTGIPDILTVSLDMYFLWDNKIGFKAINASSPDPETRNKIYFDQLSLGDLQLSGSLQIGAQIDVAILWFHKYIDIWNSGPLFSYSTLTEPQLAYLGEGGVLRLNVGPFASAQGDGDTSDSNESITITHVGGTAGDEDLAVSEGGVTQVYDGVSQITADFGNGNNSIVVAPGVLDDADLTAGDGRDTMIYQGQGNVILRGGKGDDDLEAVGPAPPRSTRAAAATRSRAAAGRPPSGSAAAATTRSTAGPATAPSRPPAA